MKARGTLAAALASAGILLAGWQAGTQAGGVSTLASGTTSSGTTGSGPTAAGATGASGTGSSGTGASGTGSSGTGASGTGSSGSASTAAGTYKGSAVQTRFGAVQVQITVASGKITDVTALQLTDDDRKSVQISNRAAPLLRSEVLSAQSADVQTISGATVTSNAYLTSLQAAIDAANL
ncbi:FMN-binding domain-containing protein [Pseudarthrobacter enclensis]|uniref:FMN-binding protein n=1 Tax=Pseudarthrobacter enclensis TaxID=993070 RepID=A0A0V8I7Q7_9MICC|nr:FMN-binding protein [Pseudarthrobacter enclensis]KSU70822.1 FMN-binding protein [Pseudarthrobacter enclensis]SCC26973.1 FMN-binding domain-containing protein [Pseudarthrobacter enclensis]